MAKRERPPVSSYQQALGLLVRREHSAAEVKRKLRQRGVADSDVAETLEALKQQGFQDDSRFAGAFARTRASAGQGPMKIRVELQQRGIEAEAASEALAAVEMDWAAEARRLAARRLAAGPADAGGRRKVVAFLCRRGFPLGLAVAAVKSAVTGAGDEDFQDEDNPSP